MSGLSDGQINWRPMEGSWSIAECIAHLNTTNALYIAGLKERLEAARQSGWTATHTNARIGLIEGWFIRSLEPPYRIKMRAPAKFTPPPACYEKDELLARWVSIHQRLLSLSSENADLDWNRIRVPSPVIPRISFSVTAVFASIAAHERRHLWQAEQIRLKLTRSEA